MTPDTILRVLLEEAGKKQLTPQQLATRADIPYATAHKLLNNKARRPTLGTVVALAGVLALHLEIRDKHGRRIG